MNYPSYKLNSQLLPKDFPRQFDAHIYFELKDFELAKAFREKAIEQFKGREVFIGDLICEPIGPHTLPMFEINYPKSEFADATIWLMHERGDLSILVHELTGDDYYDHTQAAMWLGAVVPLYYEKFKK
jgi:aromatic ring-cleaving dioxygenase